jgi:signal transduction histidine kinase
MNEMQLRQRVDVQALAEQVAQVAGRLGQALQGLLDLFRAILEQREIDLRVRVVRGQLDLADGHHADARILQFEGDQFRQILLDLVGNAQTALGNAFAVFCHVIDCL